MSELLDRIFGRRTKKSGTMAKERLQFVLVHDRINLPPERMEAMKKEILAVISKYVSVDQENVDIALQNRDRASLLVAEIPFLKALEGVDLDEDDDLPPRAKPATSNADDMPAKAKPETDKSDLPARAKPSKRANKTE
jgi:cell division topological specificity factor